MGIAPLLNKAIQHLQWRSRHHPFFLPVFQPLLPLWQPLHRCLVHRLRRLLAHEERGRSRQSQVKERLVGHRRWWSLAAGAWGEHPKLAHLIFRRGGAPVQVMVDGREAWLEGPGMLKPRGWTSAFSSRTTSPSFTSNTASTWSVLCFVWWRHGVVGVLVRAYRLGTGVHLFLCLTAGQSLCGVVERGVDSPQAWQPLLIFSDLQKLFCDGSCSRNNTGRVVVELNLHLYSANVCLEYLTAKEPNTCYSIQKYWGIENPVGSPRRTSLPLSN